MNYKGTAYHSTEHCCQCGAELWNIDPPIEGWQYYCPKCSILTCPAKELEERLRQLPEGAIGVVSAVPFKLELIEK